jgi:hypothetical protein
VVMVNFWFALPAVFVAAKVIGKVPVLVGVPLRTPPPEVSAVNVTPPGRVPLSVTAGVGVPVVVTLNEPAVPTVNVVLLALLKTGARFRLGAGDEPPQATWNANPTMQNAMTTAKMTGGTFCLDEPSRKQKQITAKGNARAKASSGYRAMRERKLDDAMLLFSGCFAAANWAGARYPGARNAAFAATVGMDRFTVTNVEPGVTGLLLN